jgi:hypothetical protein
MLFLLTTTIYLQNVPVIFKKSSKSRSKLLNRKTNVNNGGNVCPKEVIIFFEIHWINPDSKFVDF